MDTPDNWTPTCETSLARVGYVFSMTQGGKTTYRVRYGGDGWMSEELDHLPTREDYEKASAAHAAWDAERSGRRR